jgi:hypothetical protein
VALSWIFACQALDERRLQFCLDEDGQVLRVTSDESPSSLFGFEPLTIVGRLACDFIDILRPAPAGQSELSSFSAQHAGTSLHLENWVCSILTLAERAGLYMKNR